MSEKVYAENDDPVNLRVSMGIHGYLVFDGTWTQFFPGHQHLPTAPGVGWAKHGQTPPSSAQRPERLRDPDSKVPRDCKGSGM